MYSSPIHRILVAIKYPVETPPSVVKAAQLARGLHAEVHLFHAIDTPLYNEAYVASGRATGQDEESIRKHSLHNLATQAAPLRQEGLSVTVASEWDYPTHEAVLREAHSIGADLIITERHPQVSGSPWALQSADWELLRLSFKPVLLVKDDRPYQQPVIVAALDPMHRHAKPVGLDESICTQAHAFSVALGGAWYALHGYERRPHGLLQRRSPDGTEAKALRSAEARAAVNHVLQLVGLQPQAVQLREGAPAEAIIESTRELRASLLVMGALSRSGIERLLIGNTAERVIDQVSCDVLIVKPERFGIHFSRRVRGARAAGSSVA